MIVAHVVYDSALVVVPAVSIVVIGFTINAAAAYFIQVFFFVIFKIFVNSFISIAVFIF